eukprot:TRINITY_DN7628_c0_g1_i2.p1 TRINITY_DN7628_c0_g1~~TRINITY_DN7628_c0_g1_i2.p1  ORF type:complete len:349 (-),score=66.54 TRINITY_DN7628_c0_g1_i2:42-1088(-)
MFERFRLRHNLSWRSIFFAKEYIRNRQVVVTDKEEEEIVLEMLPPQMKTDFLYEIRGRVIYMHPLFATFHRISKAGFRSICGQATKVIRCLAKEIVFEKGDSCQQMLFVEDGELCYCTRSTIKRLMNKFAADMPKTSEASLSITRMRQGQRSEVSDMFLKNAASMGDEVSRGMWLSELALWVDWKTRGELFCVTNSKLIAVDLEEFFCVTSNYHELFIEAVSYAKKVARVVSTKTLSDLMDLLDLEDICVQEVDGAFGHAQTDVSFVPTIQEVQEVDGAFGHAQTDVSFVPTIQEVQEVQDVTDCTEGDGDENDPVIPKAEVEDVQDVTKGQSTVLSPCSPQSWLMPL